MESHELRLERCEIKPLGLNRRECVRHPATGKVTAIANLAERRIVSTVELIDASASGLGVRSPMPLPLAHNIKIYFDNADLAGRSGTVVRCKPTVHGYRVGIFCDACVCAA